MSRGQIMNRARKQQIVDMTAMNYGNITPTDLDLLIDYQNNVFVFAELKLRDAPLLDGQRLAFERIVDGLTRGGKKAVFIVAEHQIDDATADIPCDRCLVRMEYRQGQWVKPTREWTLRQRADFWILGTANVTPFPVQPETHGSSALKPSVDIAPDEDEIPW